MKKYELVIILSTKLSAVSQKKIIESVEKKIASLGKIIKSDSWGKKILEYPIKHQKEGIYYLFSCQLPADKAGELNRHIQIDDNILKHLLMSQR